MTVRRGRAAIVVVEIASRPATFMEVPTICLRLRGRSLENIAQRYGTVACGPEISSE